jgi:SH3 domain-containing YSC84-like protein 1
MIRYLLATALAVLPLLPAGCARAQGDEQTLVDRATLTVQGMMTQNISQDPKSLLRNARGVMVCPQVFKAGFFIGGEGGGCVLLARAGNGTWSYPAFYGLGSGSFGFQAGIQDSQLLMLIMTNRGLNALMDSQFKFGADASIAVATVGAGVSGSTTAAVGADIVAYSATRGLFGGISLEGSIMASRTEWNQAYYGQPYGARQIVVQMQGGNPGADPLREVLTRYGAPTGPTPVMAPSGLPPQTGPGYAPAYPPYQQQAPAYPQGQPYHQPQPYQQAPGYQPPPPAQPPQQQGYLPAYPPGYQAQPATPLQSGGDRPPVQEQNLGAPPAR